MKTRILPGLACLFLCLAGASGRADVADDLHGVWTGSLGGSAVTLCFNDTPSGWYYYQRHLESIALNPGSDDGTWLEGDTGKETGTWTLSVGEDGSTSTGTWSKTGGGKSLPVKLRRLSTDGCDSDAYNRPLEAAPPELVAGKAQSFAGKKYRVLSVSLSKDLSAGSIELLESGPAIDAINHQLQGADLRKSLNANLYQCRRYRLSEPSGAGDATDQASIEPTLWTARWLTLASREDAYCYEHPSITLSYTTWELDHGQVYNLAAWFNAGVKPDCKDCTLNVSKPLNALVLATAAKDPNAESDCVDAMSGVDAPIYELALGEHGVIFNPSLSSGQAGPDCWTFVVEVPYAKLLPLLTPTGKAEVRALMAAPAK